MADEALDLSQALQVARAFNLAFNNAFMYGGRHQSTKDSAVTFLTVLEPILATTGSITVSVEKGSIYLENHCVDKLVSVPRITSRFTRAGLQSISFDRSISSIGAEALFYILGSVSEFHNVETMQRFLMHEQLAGVKINYVMYQKITVDDTVVSKNALSETQQLLNSHYLSSPEAPSPATAGSLLGSLSEILSLHGAEENLDLSSTSDSPPSGLSQAEYDTFISARILTFNRQLDLESPAGEAVLTPAEMLESVHRLKESVLENIRLQKEAGKLIAADEQALSEINRISYQVIVRLIKEEYRGDRSISIKRLAQIIRRMLPDIKELKYLLPQLKDGLFAEGMTPAEYLSLVKELSKELDSDELTQVMADASDQIGLSLTELIDGIREAPEEAARLIVLAAEIKKGGITADDQQMSVVLSDYIEKVSRAMALQSPDAAAINGGTLLKASVTRIERELLDRLKAQNVPVNTISEVAQRLACQFTETVSSLKGDWVRNNIGSSEKLSEEAILSIISQIAENSRDDYGVTHEIRTMLISNGYAPETIDTIINKARLRIETAATHSLEIPPGIHNAKNTLFFLDREIKLNLRYNTPVSTMLVSFESAVDLKTGSFINITPDMTVQLTGQSLKLLKLLQKRDIDIIGVYEMPNGSIPLMFFPMTDLTGALYIKKRIEREFPRHEFIVDGTAVHIEPTVSVLDFNKKLTPDTASFLKLMLQKHCQPRLT